MSRSRDLSKIDTKDLKDELERRASVMPSPKRRPVIDWVPVVNACISVVDGVRRDGTYDEYEQFVAEAAIEAVYGPDVWPWWNANFGRR